MKTKSLLLLLLFTILIACNSRNEKAKESKKSIEAKQEVNTSIDPKEKLKDKSIYDSKFLEKENVLINDHKVILTKDEFELQKLKENAERLSPEEQRKKEFGGVQRT